MDEHKDRPTETFGRFLVDESYPETLVDFTRDGRGNRRFGFAHLDDPLWGDEPPEQEPEEDDEGA